MKLHILAMICQLGQPCDAGTARAVQRLVAPEGMIVCPVSAPLITSAAGPSEGEYWRVRCELR